MKLNELRFPIQLGANQTIKEPANVLGCTVWPVYQGSKHIKNIVCEEELLELAELAL